MADFKNSKTQVNAAASELKFNAEPLLRESVNLDQSALSLELSKISGFDLDVVEANYEIIAQQYGYKGDTQGDTVARQTNQLKVEETKEHAQGLSSVDPVRRMTDGDRLAEMSKDIPVVGWSVGVYNKIDKLGRIAVADAAASVVGQVKGGAEQMALADVANSAKETIALLPEDQQKKLSDLHDRYADFKGMDRADLRSDFLVDPQMRRIIPQRIESRDKFKFFKDRITDEEMDIFQQAFDIMDSAPAKQIKQEQLAESEFTQFAQSAKSISASIRSDLKVDESMAQTVIGQLVGGAASSVPYVVEGLINPALVAVAAESALFNEAIEEYRKFDPSASPEDQLKLGLIVGIPGAVLEVVAGAPMRLAQILKVGTKTTRGMIIREAIKSGLSEGFTESAQGGLLDLMASEEFDEGREVLTGEGFGRRLKEFFVGGTIGALLGGGGTAINFFKNPGLEKFLDQDGHSPEAYNAVSSQMSKEEFIGSFETEHMKGLAEAAYNGSKEAQDQIRLFAEKLKADENHRRVLADIDLIAKQDEQRRLDELGTEVSLDEQEAFKEFEKKDPTELMSEEELAEFEAERDQMTPEEEAKLEREFFEEEEAAAMSDTVDFNQELLQAVKNAGGLKRTDLAPGVKNPKKGDPKGKKDLGLTGELDRIAENMRDSNDKRVKGLFKKDPQKLDDLRQSLSERGFHFDTIAEMLDAIGGSVSGLEQFSIQGGGIFSRARPEVKGRLTTAERLKAATGKVRELGQKRLKAFKEKAAAQRVKAKAKSESQKADIRIRAAKRLQTEINKRIAAVKQLKKDRADLTESIGALEEMVKKLPLAVRGKAMNGFKTLAKKQSIEAQQKHLDKLADRVSEIFNNYFTKEAKTMLSKNLKRFSPTNATARKKIDLLITPDTRVNIETANKAAQMTAKEAQAAAAALQDSEGNIDDANLVEFELIHIFGGTLAKKPKAEAKRSELNESGKSDRSSAEAVRAIKGNVKDKSELTNLESFLIQNPNKTGAKISFSKDNGKHSGGTVGGVTIGGREDIMSGTSPVEIIIANGLSNEQLIHVVGHEILHANLREIPTETRVKALSAVKEIVTDKQFIEDVRKNWKFTKDEAGDMRAFEEILAEHSGRMFAKDFLTRGELISAASKATPSRVGKELDWVGLAKDMLVKVYRVARHAFMGSPDATKKLDDLARLINERWTKNTIKTLGDQQILFSTDSVESMDQAAILPDQPAADQPASAERLMAANKALLQLVDTGRTKAKEWLENRAAEKARLEAEFIKAVLPTGVEAKTAAERQADLEAMPKLKLFSTKMKDTVIGGLGGLEIILENMSYTKGMFQNIFTSEIVIPSTEATIKERELYQGWVLDFEKGMSDLLSIKNKKLGKEIKKIRKKLNEWHKPKDGTETQIVYKSGSGPAKAQRMSVNSAISLIMTAKDKSLSKTLERMEVTETTVEQAETFVKNVTGVEASDIIAIIQPIWKKVGKLVQNTIEEVEGHRPDFRDDHVTIHRSSWQDTASSTDLTSASYTKEWGKNSSLKSRTGSTEELVFQPYDQDLNIHMTQMAHYVAFAGLAQKMNNVLMSKRVTDAMIQGGGSQEMVNQLRTQIKDILESTKNTTSYEKVASYILGNLSVNKLALNPPSAFKQLASGLASMAFIPVKSYYDGIVDLVPGSGSMMNAVSTLAKTSYVKDRWGRGFERDVSTAMDRMGDQILPEANWSSSVMILTRLGDMGGVILAGWPVYKHHYNKNKHLGHKEATRIAEQQFALVSNRVQQSSLKMDVSGFQRVSAFAKFFTQYMTSPIQYLRNQEAAVRAAHRGRISWAEAAKVVFVFQVVLPQMFTAMSSAFKLLWEDDEEKWERIKHNHWNALWLGSFNALPVAGDVLDSFISTIVMGKDSPFYKKEFSQQLNDTVTAVMKGFYETVTGEEISDKLAGSEMFLEAALTLFTKLGYSSFKRQAKGAAAAFDPDEEDRLFRLFGYTESALGGDGSDDAATGVKQSNFEKGSRSGSREGSRGSGSRKGSR